MKSQKGITLASLVIIIIIVLIIAGVSISNGIQSINQTKLEAFYTQLEIIQKRVDEIASTNESYTDSSKNKINIKTESGQTLTADQNTL